MTPSHEETPRDTWLILMISCSGRMTIISPCRVLGIGERLHGVGTWRGPGGEWSGSSGITDMLTGGIGRGTLWGFLVGKIYTEDIAVVRFHLSIANYI